MGKKDKRVDAYIAKAAPFARPILNHLRELVHGACPEVEETIKWNFPHFDYNGMFCSMASFKKHCAFGFWKAAILTDPDKRLVAMGETAMGHLGQLTKLSDLPSDKIMMKYLKEAARLNQAGIKIPRPKKSTKKELIIPDYFRKALAKNKHAVKTFEGFSHSNKKDYVEWVTEAKTEETRNQRLTTAIAWMAEGKSRNWKYERK